MKLILSPHSSDHTRIFDITDQFTSYERGLFGWKREGQNTMIGFTSAYLKRRFRQVLIWDGDKLRDIIDGFTRFEKLKRREPIAREGISAPVLTRSDFTSRRRRTRR